MLSRRAATLVELLVALTLASIVLGAAATSMRGQQRTHGRIAAVSGSDRQLRSGASVLAAQLALLDPVAGDLSAGEATDTAIQFRAPIAASLACDRSVGSATFVPDAAGPVAFGGAASLPRTGDSLWWLGDSAWTGGRINAVATIAAVCSVPVPAVGDALHVALSGSNDTIPAGAPLRITRQTRYGLYRAGDGTLQLGFREWSESAHSFSSPQPVAGPLLPAASGRRSGFRYFDDAGQELPGGAIPLDPRQVARIRIALHSRVAVHEAGQDSIRCDSVDVALHRAAGP